jgi:hypothetical protein
MGDMDEENNVNHERPVTRISVPSTPQGATERTEAQNRAVELIKKADSFVAVACYHDDVERSGYTQIVSMVGATPGNSEAKNIVEGFRKWLEEFKKKFREEEGRHG